MKPSEINLIKKILVFIFELSNIFPTSFSVYDKFLIPFMKANLEPSNPFFAGITIGFIFFDVIRIIIFILSIGTLIHIHKYAKQYNVFGYTDTFYEKV
jgi:hypothetical protein